MNKAQKEVLKTSLADEKKVIMELKQVYNRAKLDCEERIRQLSMRTDMENLQTIIYQKKYQEALKKQLDDVLDKLNSNQFNTIEEYLHVCYENGYIGTMYDLQHQGIPLTVPINQKQVAKAIQVDTKLSSNYYKSNPLKGRIAEDVDRLKTSIRAELSRGIANGSSWNDVAVKISKGMNNPIDKAYRDAVRIARTEGHRVQQSATLDAQKVAKDKGADVLKQWDSTMDKKTRPTHQRLDGQVREIEEPFEIDGKTAMFAGDFGIPSEDINCRCIITQRARWEMDEDELQTLQERAEFFGLDKSEDFNDFKQKYLKLPEKADTIKVEELSEATIGGLSSYPKKHQKSVLEFLNNAPAECRKAWNDVCDDFHIVSAKDYKTMTGRTAKGAFYSPNLDAVYLNITTHAKGSDYQTPYQVVFHEFGHHMDYILNRKYGDKNAYQIGISTTMNSKRSFSETYKNGIFGKTLKQEANEAIEMFAKKHGLFVDDSEIEKQIIESLKGSRISDSERKNYIDYAMKQARIKARVGVEKAFCEHMKKELTIIQRADISDMFEPVMSKENAYPFGFGHGSNYWGSRDNGKEGFAEMYSATINNPESLEQIKKFFPKSYEIFLKMLEVVE